MNAKSLTLTECKNMSLKMNYSNYQNDELKTILHSPREIAKEPYKLLVSYVLNSIIDAFFDEEEKDTDDFTIWGKQLPSDMLFRFIDECILDFHAAGEDGDTIRILGQGYTIRKHSEIDYTKAKHIFAWDRGELTTITKEGVKCVEHSEPQTYEERKAIFSDNRLYYWKVMVTGADDEGYYQLTDMEVALYCWAKWIVHIPMKATVNEDMIKDWWKQEYSYFELPLKEVVSCFNHEMIRDNSMNTPCIFSAEKVRVWNEQHGQKSIIDTIDKEKAEKIWFTDIAVTLMRM